MRLSELHPVLSREERCALAVACGISTGYLWQLATRWRRKKPTVDLLAKLAAAEPRLTVAELVKEFADVQTAFAGSAF
ncbi:hypothetical protein [Variovorax boronicumulans]|uniref:hypothetical protein n=1 Tax=Variovorax boronicumulans TaxID=436515 RepID=UPI0012FDED23|nr:hypothetical protein [Variovorax boronicumulans]